MTLSQRATARAIVRALVALDAAIITALLAAGTSTTITITVIVLLTLIDLLAIALIMRRRQPASRTLMQEIMRLEKNGPDALLAEAKARYASHVSAKDALTISASYCSKGDGPNAEIHAQKALKLLEETGVHTLTDQESRVIVELAQIALFDARVAQGHFAEAAAGLRPYIDVSPAPNMLTALVIWALYLAEQHDNARVMLGHFRMEHNKSAAKKSPAQPGAILRIPPKYALIVAYMRHKLLGVINADDLLTHRDAFPDWQDELARNAHNPYGAQLRDIVADLDTVLV